MKKYTVYKRFSIQVSQPVMAENMGEAEKKLEGFGVGKFVKPTSGTELCDWSRLPGTMIAEDYEE